MRLCTVTAFHFSKTCISGVPRRHLQCLATKHPNCPALPQLHGPHSTLPMRRPCLLCHLRSPSPSPSPALHSDPSASSLPPLFPPPSPPLPPSPFLISLKPPSLPPFLPRTLVPLAPISQAQGRHPKQPLSTHPPISGAHPREHHWVRVECRVGRRRAVTQQHPLSPPRLHHRGDLRVMVGLRSRHTLTGDLTGDLSGHHRWGHKGVLKGPPHGASPVFNSSPMLPYAAPCSPMLPLYGPHPSSQAQQAPNQAQW